MDRGGRGCKFRGECILVGIEGRQFGAERHARGARERSCGDKEVRFLLVGKGQRIRQHQAAFRVGVADLHRQPLAALQNVSRPERAARNGVLRRRDDDAQPHAQAGLHDHRGEAQDVSRAAHILLHERHAARRLDVEPASVEHDPLAHEGDSRITFRTPAQIDEAGRPVAASADGVEHGKLARQRVPIHNRNAGAETRCERGGNPRQIVRRKIVCGRVDKVAGQKNAIPDRRDRGGVHVLRKDKTSQAFLGFPVAIEPVAAEREGQGRKRRIGNGARQPVSPRREPGRQLPKEHRRALGRSGDAEAEEHTPDIPALVGYEHPAACVRLETLRSGEASFALGQGL
jgi:hypothetical protein